MAPNCDETANPAISFGRIRVGVVAPKDRINSFAQPGGKNINGCLVVPE